MRTIRFPRALVPFIETALDYRDLLGHDGDGLLFPSKLNQGRPISTSKIGVHVKRILAAAG